MGHQNANVVHASSRTPHHQKNKLPGVYHTRYLSEPHATSSIATARENLGQLSMRQRWPTEASYNPPSSGRPPATRQLNYTEGVLLEGPPRTQLPITEEIGRTTFTNDHSLIHVSGVDVDVSPSQGHSQTGGVTTQSRPHQGRVPLASIATTVASSGLERTSTGTNDPHFYSSPVAMEAPLALERVQPQPSATPTRIQRKQSRISVAKLEKSTSIGHWTDVLVKLPPPIPPRIRTRSHDVARNNRPSTILRSSQDSRGSGGTTYSAPPSTSSFSHLSNRFPSSEQITSDQRAYELPPVDVIDHTIQLDPLEEEPIAANNYVPGKPEPTPIPSHIHRADSLNTSSAHVLPQNVPRSLVTQPPVGYVHVPPDLAHSTIYPPQPSSATPISNQVRRLNHIIPRIVRRRRTDGSHHAANIFVVPDNMSQNSYLKPAEYEDIPDTYSVTTTYSDYESR